jgi:tetratricopeptide (TPR) repeat protein
VPAASGAARRRRLVIVGVGLVLLVGVGLGVAWRLGVLPLSAVNVAELQPVALPDLSSMEQEPRTQIEKVYAKVTALRASGNPDPAALGFAEGTFGSLLLAYGLTGAEAPLTNAEALAPKEPRWPYYLARVHREAGDLERAAADYERARALMPDYGPAMIRVAQVYRDLGRDAEAQQLGETALAADPKAASAHDLLGQMAADRGDTQAAITHFEAVLALQPGASAVHSPLALAYEKVGQPEKRREHLALMGNVRPTINDPMEYALQQIKVGKDVLLMQADQALQANRPADAIEFYNKVLASDPNNARAHLNKGVAMGQLGDTAGSIQAMQTAVAADGTNPTFRQILADQLAEAGRTDEADAAYREALALDPKDAKANRGLAELLRTRGRCEEALVNYGFAEEILAKDTVLRIKRVFCLVTLGRYAEARADLEAAHASAPDDLDVVDALARVLAAAPDEATRDGDQALVLAKSLAPQRQGVDAKETMAMAFAAAGSFEDAIRWQEEAIQLATRDRNAVWLDSLRANLDRYRQQQPASAAWPPYVLNPAVATP